MEFFIWGVEKWALKEEHLLLRVVIRGFIRHDYKVLWMISAKTLDQKRAGKHWNTCRGSLDAGKDRKNYGAYFFSFNCYEGRQEPSFWTNRSEEIKTNSKISLVTFKWDKSSDATFFSKLFEFWRRVGLMVGALDSESSGLGSSPGPSCSKCG